jgi:hypothetical protein
MPVGDVIPENGFVIQHIRNHFIILTDEQRHALESIEINHALWVYGLLRYDDFMGKGHEFRFCKRWLSKATIGGVTGFVSDSDTPAEYTKSY